MHLPSPTHRHSYGMEIPSSLQQIRRSLSRSPSKPSRFQLRRSDSSGSPISPLALSRAFSPKATFYDKSPIAFFPETPAAPQPKKRITLRRSTPLRCSPRNRAPSKSPRRVLSESTDNGNASPFNARPAIGDENMGHHPDKAATDSRSALRFDINDKPIKFGISRARPELGAASPPKSTPLKRSDGIMNTDAVSIGSPLPKRRSLHGASATGADFDVFDQASTTPRTSLGESSRPSDMDFGSSVLFAPSTAQSTQSPLRRTSSLRKSTLSQRHGASLNRSKPIFGPDFAVPGAPAFKIRHRQSLDLSGSQSPALVHTPLRQSTHFEMTRPMPQQPFMRQSTGSHQPHPLSNTLSLTPSTSASSPVEEPMEDAPPAITNAPRKHIFSRSLPLGVARPFEPVQDAEGTFETPKPDAFKHLRPDLEGFRSTGLLSKKNRNLDVENAINRYVPPGTPSKRASFPPVTASPSANRGNFMTRLSRPEFGQPSTPFNVHKQSSSASFGQGVSIFGSHSRHERRSSFASVDGDENSLSPCGNRMTDSQSSIDDMPPTPTKQGDSFGRRKNSSLRRQTFHHTRTSLGSDTFTAPVGPQTPQISFSTPAVKKSSPHSPNESFTPPDPSTLSISARRGSLPLNASHGSNMFPPATPTTPRDHSNIFGRSSISLGPFHGVTENDVEVCLYERFDHFNLFGDGEFSKVYRAEKVPERGFGSPSAPQVYAVKKTKKPFTGPGDREKKMQEVRILEALRGSDHIVHLEDYWEHNGHLYIQTEFCEEGNLQRFLDHAGNKGRLDDFRIWKILLEVTLVSSSPT